MIVVLVNGRWSVAHCYIVHREALHFFYLASTFLQLSGRSTALVLQALVLLLPSPARASGTRVAVPASGPSCVI